MGYVGTGVAYAGPLADTATGVIAFREAKDNIGRISAATQIQAGALAGSIILGPWAALHALGAYTIDVARQLHEKEKQHDRIKRKKRNLYRTLGIALGAGHSPVIAARLAAASAGYSPETVAPLGSDNPYFNPRTKAADTELGLLLEYGPGADAARQAFIDAQNEEFARRPFPAYGLLPAPFVTLRRT